ncbi:MAG: peptide chain release factor N(5)-glutamine methyltransferase [Eggerthellaceae bacterium]|nr:peptide chain release factor N(5)-glutamine methyltransferase [Eggerthellaceae bacterium]
MANDLWTVRSTLSWIEEFLGKRNIENPRLAAEQLASAALGLSRTQLYMDFERPLDLEERKVLRGYVRQRANGVPLQYITGFAPFRYISVKVKPPVLIPRPETEVLVSEALKCLPPKAAKEGVWSRDANDASDDGNPPEKPDDIKTYNVADIGCGSGCIACSVAYERPDTEVHAIDISQNAIDLTLENADSLGVGDRVKVSKRSLEEMDAEEYASFFDLIISNPPYIPTGVLATLSDEVTGYESRASLDGGADGLDLFRKLVNASMEFLKPGGHLACELFEASLDEAASIALNAGFCDAKIINDLNRRPRVLIARKGADKSGCI